MSCALVVVESRTPPMVGPSVNRCMVWGVKILQVQRVKGGIRAFIGVKPRARTAAT